MALLSVDVTQLTQTIRREFDAITGRELAKSASLAINKVLRSDLVMIAREIRKEYNMNVFDSKSQMKLQPSTMNTLIGTISGDASFTPFEYFKVTGEEMNTGNGIKLKREAKYGIKNGKRVVEGRKTGVFGGSGRMSTFEVAITKSSTTLFTHAFIATTKNGPMLFNRGAYNYRTNKFGSIPERLPMNRLRTLSVWQEMRSKNIMGKSQILLQTEYAKELTRLLSLRLTQMGHWR